MAKRTYEFEILAKVDQAARAISAFAGKTQQQLNTISLTTSISAIKDGFDLVSGAGQAAFGTVRAAIEEVTKEAIEAEQAQFKMANSLRLSGEYSDAAARSFNKLAKDLQNTTTFTDDAVLSSVGLAKQYGLTNDEARQTIKVAADLAAMTGDTLNGATQRLAQTFNGFVDRDLKKMNPALGKLSLEALNAGRAISLIEPSVRGTADALANTFGGQISNINKNFNELKETFGSFIVDNAAIRTSLKFINDGLKALNTELEKNGDSIRSLITDGFVLLIQAVPLVARALDNIVRNLAAVYYAGKAFAAVLGAIGAAIANLGNDEAKMEIFKALGEDLDDLQVQFGNFLNRTDDVFQPIINQADKLAKKVAGVATATKGVNDELGKLGQGPKGGGLAARGLDPEELSRYQLQVGRLKDQFDDLIKTKVQGLADRPLQGFVTFLIKGQEEIDKTKREIDLAIREIISSKRIPDALKQQAIGFAEEAKTNLVKGLKNEVIPALLGNVVSAVKKGAAGAAEAVASVVGGIVDAYFPGLGKIVKEFIEFLSLGPDEVKRLVTEFEMAVPKVVENILTSIPALIEQVIKNAPKVIEKIIEMLPRIIIAFVKGIPQIITAFVNSIPQIIEAFIRGVPQIIAELVKAAPDIAKALIDAIVNLAKGDALGGAFKGVFGGGGGGGIGGFIGDVVGGIGDVFSDVGDWFGLAGGGRIPDLARFRGDRFGPVMLDAGEQVLNRDLSADLQRAIDQGGFGGGEYHVTAIVQVQEQELARAIFRLNRGGFRTA